MNTEGKSDGSSAGSPALDSPATAAAYPANTDRITARVLGMLEHPQLALRLALLAALLSSSSLFIGFYLDDYVGRYIYSGLEGARHLFDLYVGGYGLANGNPVDNHWQIEAGWAPWWIYDTLLIRLFRPFGELTHWLDAWLWPDSAALQHLHSLAWLVLLVLAATRMYRVAMGPMLGGLAAVLFAFDHTHGFVVGYICNRHSLITATLGVCALAEHVRAHPAPASTVAVTAGTRPALAGRGWFGPLLYSAAMVSGESTIAIGGYLFAYVLFVHGGSLWRRALAFAPYALITLGFRVGYNLAGYGASGSGLYLDPVRQPLAYLSAFVERAPVLLLGQFALPPSEAYVVVGPLYARIILIVAIAFVIALGVALWPLLRRNRLARFWLAGALLSLIPAAATYPNNRQLLFTSFGAMALIAQLWQLHVVELGDRAPTRLLRFSRELGGGLLFAHLVLSPIALPFTTCTVALAGPLQAAPRTIGDDIGGRDAVFVTAPEYFAVRLVQLERRIEHKPLPRRFRALAFGDEQVTVHRTGERTLELDYAGGILSTPFMELYRDRHLPMHPGQRIELAGLGIEVLEVTADSRVSRARFVFDTALEAPSFRFYYWSEQGFAPFVPPAVGQSRRLPPARFQVGLR